MHSTLVSLGILQTYGGTVSVSVTVSVSGTVSMSVTLMERLMSISINLYKQAFHCVKTI